jgi:hypothetical protein
MRRLFSTVGLHEVVLERHVRAAYLCGMTDGPRALTTSFWAARGEVPSR